MSDEDKYADRCCFEGPYGRCGLRGTISFSTQGGPWFCTYHFDLQRCGSREHSFGDFQNWVADEIACGSDRWLRHPIGEWWDRITGKIGPGFPWTWCETWDQKIGKPKESERVET